MPSPYSEKDKIFLAAIDRILSPKDKDKLYNAKKIKLTSTLVHVTFPLLWLITLGRIKSIIDFDAEDGRIIE